MIYAYKTQDIASCKTLAWVKSARVNSAWSYKAYYIQL